MNNILLKTIYMLSRYFLYGFLLQLLFLNFGLAIHAKGQYKSIEEVTVNISKTQLTLGQFFREVEKQTSFTFSYDSKKIDRQTSLVFEHTSGTVEDFLKSATEQTILSFRQYNHSIDVLKDEAREVIAFQVEEDDDLTIIGTVTDINGEPLPGVTVSIPGTGIGTATDMEGRYSLSVPEGSTLVFSFIGFESQQVTVGNQTVIDIALSEDISSLEEVVVVGYGEQRKKEITGAVASVNAESFIQGNVGDAARLIQGKVAGLTVVTPTGDPSKSSQILLRGTATLATSTQPLILIDGIPGDLNTLGQDDIESIDVLKDGSAAAIYGTRGTNGVILITSKRNRGQIQPTLQYSGYISTEEFTRIPRMLSADEYRERIAAGAAFSDLGAETDWIAEISNKTPITQYHSLSLQGGGTKTTYMASLNYRQSPGMILNYDYNTLNSRVDINHQMFDDKLTLNLNFISNENKRNVDFDQIGQGLSDSPSSGVFNSALWRNPTAPIKNEDGQCSL